MKVPFRERSFRLRQRHNLAALVRMSENEFAGFYRRARAGRGLYSASFDLWLREPISIAEMVVRVFKGRNTIKIQ